MSTYDYDLVVIGGGSGGLAASKEAAKAKPGAKVACFDFVKPTIHGTKWGLGGTCVNVGCIPKKLMHYGSLLGHHFASDANEYGWDLGEKKHSWSKMSTLVLNYIKSLNFSYKLGLTGSKVKYFNAHARFIDPHTISYKGTDGKENKLSADKVIIAVGGRPKLGDTPGIECCISSDDIFWAKKAPGKTLVIGGGYIAMECAGLIHGLGFETTVMVRSQFMRQFDDQCGAMVGELMERDGVRFVAPASHIAFRKVNRAPIPADAKDVGNGVFQISSEGDKVRLQHPSGCIEVRDSKAGTSTWEIPAGPVEVDYVRNDDSVKTVHTEVFDTVLVAIGREACVDDLDLVNCGVKMLRGKVIVDPSERTTADNIYAIGDAAIGVPSHDGTAATLSQARERPELTPVAIQAGVLLARRIMKDAKQLMDYSVIPTTVFTPVEYGFCGLTQDEAERDLKVGGIGKENVEVYWSRFGNLEISPTHAHIVPTKSNIFLGKNLWARQYTRKNQLWWSEANFDSGNNVVFTTADGKKIEGDVADKVQNASGDWVYNVTFADGTTAENVKEEALELQEFADNERAEVYVKANALAKLVVDKRSDKVLGVHFVGPNAGEVLQGFSLALQLGATKAAFDKMVGIHPTAAEEFAVLTVTKSSGNTFMKKAGCGGGSCG